MNDWQDEWWKQIEKTAADVEEFFTEVGDVAESLAEEVSGNVDSFLKQFQLDIVGEVDSFIQDFVDVIVTTSDEIEAALSEDWENFMDEDFTSVSYQKPSSQVNPACIDCANYHGQAYNGNLLVCAMHPNGYEDKSCPDWEKENRR
jgi:ElaB/YqjD/DUF883 family membrane-anchored ribosome-binding protein